MFVKTIQHSISSYLNHILCDDLALRSIQCSGVVVDLIQNHWKRINILTHFDSNVFSLYVGVAYSVLSVKRKK